MVADTVNGVLFQNDEREHEGHDHPHPNAQAYVNKPLPKLIEVIQKPHRALRILNGLGWIRSSGITNGSHGQILG